MAGGITSEDIKLNVIVNGNKAQKEILKLDNAYHDMKETVGELRNTKAKLLKTEKEYTKTLSDVQKALTRHTQTLNNNKAQLNALQEKKNELMQDEKANAKEIKKINAAIKKQTGLVEENRKKQIELQASEQKAKAAKEAVTKSIKANNAAIKEQSEAIKKNRTEHKEKIKQLGVEQMTLKQLGKALRDTKIAYDNAVPDSDAQKKAAKQYHEIQNRIDHLSLNAQKAEKNLTFRGAAKGVKNFAMIAIAAITGIVMLMSRLLGSVIRTRAEFEKYGAVLTNTLGSKSEARKAMKMIVDFASKTPFQVNELTASFVKLANAGFIPTREEMRKLGDLAASTGKSFDQLTEAVLDAQTGEFERLKEFGIKAKKQGENITFTFKGVETQIKNNEKAIQSYLLSLGDLNGVYGSMSAISNTLEGQLSNLSDNWDMLLNAIGERLSGAIKGTVSVLGGLIGKTKEFLEIPMEDKLRKEKSEMNALVNSIMSVTENQELRKRMLMELQQKYPDYFKNIDIEKTTNTELKKIIGLVNDEYNEKIKLMAMQGKAEERMKRQAEILNEESTIIKEVSAEYKKLFKDVGNDKTFEEKIAAIKDYYKENKIVEYKNQSTSFGSTSTKVDVSASRIDVLSRKQENYNQLKTEYNKITQEQIDKEKELKEVQDSLTGKKNKTDQATVKEGEERVVNGVKSKWNGSEWEAVKTKPKGNGTGGAKSKTSAPDTEQMEIDLMNKGREKEIAQEEKRHQEKLEAYKNYGKATELEKQQHAQNLRNIEESYLKESLESDKIGTKEKLGLLQTALTEQKVSEEFFISERKTLQEIAEQELWELKESYKLLSLEQLEQREIEEFEQTEAAKALWLENEDLYGKAIQEIKNKYIEEQKEIDRLAIGNTDYDTELEKYKAMLDKKLITQKEYDKKEEKVTKEANKTKFQNYAATFDAMGGLVSQAFGQSKGAALAQIAFDTASALSALMAHAEKNPMNSITFGSAGMAQYIAGVARIMGNVAKAKKALSQAKPVSQNYEGKYHVRGAQDGKNYHVPYLGNTGTTIIKEPALVSERGAEAVIDNQTLYSPKKDNIGMTVMDHFNAIRAIKFNFLGRTPQFAEGKYPQTNTQSTTVQVQQQTDPVLMEMLSKLSQRLDAPIRADVNYFEFEDARNKINALTDRVSG